MAGHGALILVVGPSGVGKDTLIDEAAAALAATSRFHFARRAITRPADAGGEDHIPYDESTFRQAEQDDAFLLSWRAHGLCYGVPKDPAARLRADGAAIVANVSRTVIDDARNRLQPVRVIMVRAAHETIRRRLADRGRETPADIEARLARADAYAVSGRDVLYVDNDGTVEEGAKSMIAALEAASNAEWQTAE